MSLQTKEQQTRLTHKLKRELGAFILQALSDSDVIEIMVNSDGRIWLDKKRKETKGFSSANLSEGQEGESVEDREDSTIGLYDTGKTMNAGDLLIALGTIAMMNDKEINEDHPMLQAVLPLDGSRVQGLIPPATPMGPSLTIRKHSSSVFPLSLYVKEGRIPQEQADYLRECIRRSKNIVVAGGTSSGKTTFVNALIKELLQIAPRERIIVMEDTFEIKCETNNKERLVTTEQVTMNMLVRASMRMRPDRLVVGEVRGMESLDLLKSWNTGHPGGLATIHSNDAYSTLIRFENLNMEATKNSPQCRLIGETVNVVVYMENAGKRGRQITQIMEVRGYEREKYITEMVYELSNIKELREQNQCNEDRGLAL